jgi:hypothetical protein
MWPRLRHGVKVRPSIVAGAALLAAGCSASTIDEPIPLQLSDGNRGFRMFGEVNYTGSAQEARDVVQKTLDDACGGKSRMIRFVSTPDLSGPIDVVNFDAAAACED